MSSIGNDDELVGVHICCFCLKRYTSQLALHSHMYIHKGSFRCDFADCVKTCTNLETLTRHQQSHRKAPQKKRRQNSRTKEEFDSQIKKKRTRNENNMNLDMPTQMAVLPCPDEFFDANFLSESFDYLENLELQKRSVSTQGKLLLAEHDVCSFQEIYHRVTDLEFYFRNMINFSVCRMQEWTENLRNKIKQKIKAEVATMEFDRLVLANSIDKVSLERFMISTYIAQQCYTELVRKIDELLGNLAEFQFFVDATTDSQKEAILFSLTKAQHTSKECILKENGVYFCKHLLRKI